VDSGVAIFTGSGNLSVNLTMQDRSVPLAMIVTIGNQAMIGVEQLIDSVIEDERITAVGIHIEGLRDLPQFVAVAKRAAAVGKPIVAIKTGKSDTGARIAMSHTAILAGETDLYDTLFDRLGVAQVQDLECFLESLKLLSVVGPLPGRRIASMSCSGGEASLIADLVQDTSLEFPEIGPEQTRRLRETLNEYVGISNPLDYHTFIWGDQERLRQTFVAMLEGGYDLTLLLLDVPLLKPGELNEWAMACDAFADACEATGQRGAVVCSLAESMPTQVRDDLIARSIAPMLGMPQAIAAVQAAATAGHILEPVPQLPASAPMPASRHSVDECAAKKLLASHGLKTTGARVVSSTGAAQTTARELGFPLALKASIKGVNHKTEIDGIALNVASLEEVAVQGERLLNLGGDLLVERMVAPGIAELLLGVSYDAQFGHYLVLGCGGTLVELIADRQLLLLPASDTQIRQALERLRIAPLLAGYRGRPAADINAIVASVQGLTGLVVEQADRILEVDINPLIVAEEGGGATVADALIVYRTETHATTEEETNGERNHVQCS
jgi:acyl-CoA synthetase (NDP forming)